MDDPYLWLEDVDGDEAMAWVASRNAASESRYFELPLFQELQASILSIMEADDRLVMPQTVEGDEVTNLWTDSKHRRGIWRRTTWSSFEADADDWDTILDIDALNEAEGESWVLKGLNVRKPDRKRALLELSPGGGDATVVREFDLETKQFLPESEGGFVLPVAKTSIAWIDDDTVYVGTELGEDSLTKSGYPRHVREWKRGAPIADAPVVFSTAADDIGAEASVLTLAGYRHHVVSRAVTFFSAETFIRRDGQLLRINTPIDAVTTVRRDSVFVLLRSDWERPEGTFVTGSVLVADLEASLGDDAVFTALFTPSDTVALEGFFFTENKILLALLDDVKFRIEARISTDNGWVEVPVEGQPDTWSASAWPVEPDSSDEIWLAGLDFLTPVTLMRSDLSTINFRRSSPSRFDSSGFETQQRFVKSADGTRIPYFITGPADTDGQAMPTLVNAYGGFQVPMTPSYSGQSGLAWLTAGGRSVVANIRGGGEYGPAWHRAGLRENRHLVYEDLEAVARDLLDRGDTTVRQLGVTGGSNGGLLVGNMYVRSPELWGAIACMVPLLDMKRYSHLLAGASWVAEYGDPDTDDWEFIKTFSPYHLVDGSVDYPPLLLVTSTRDDRVHPGHARKMGAKLLELGKDVTYWENVEGGHGSAADALQASKLWALIYTFLREKLFV